VTNSPWVRLVRSGLKDRKRPGQRCATLSEAIKSVLDKEWYGPLTRYQSPVGARLDDADGYCKLLKFDPETLEGSRKYHARDLTAEELCQIVVGDDGAGRNDRT
jgi:hypothetical protein